MTQATIAGPAWIPKFLAVLEETRVIKRAAEAAQISRRSVDYQREVNPRFVERFEAILGGRTFPQTVTSLADIPKPRRTAGWPKIFLEQLAATSNVSASADHADVPIATVYKKRRSDPEFALEWRKALYEGYDNLEMEVLAQLRGNLPERKIDVANAIRQLAAHRKTVAEMRLVEEDVNEQDVLDSIDAKIDKMKAEWAASKRMAQRDG